jgi:hypothetical protein
VATGRIYPARGQGWLDGQHVGGLVVVAGMELRAKALLV